MSEQSYIGAEIRAAQGRMTYTVTRYLTSDETLRRGLYDADCSRCGSTITIWIDFKTGAARKVTSCHLHHAWYCCSLARHRREKDEYAKTGR